MKCNVGRMDRALRISVGLAANNVIGALEGQDGSGTNI